jgi:hypothetical protein
MKVGGRGVAGDADPGRGDRPVGGKKGGLNPGGLVLAHFTEGDIREARWRTSGR